MQACVYASMYVYMHPCMCACMPVCMYVCMYVYVYQGMHFSRHSVTWRKFCGCVACIIAVTAKPLSVTPALFWSYEFFNLVLKRLEPDYDQEFRHYEGNGFVAITTNITYVIHPFG